MCVKLGIDHNARLLADFLERTTASEQLLKQQQRDDALRQVEGLSDSKALLQVPGDQHIITEDDEATSVRMQAMRQQSFDHLTLPDDF